MMLGYVLAEPYWGRGLMTEAVKRMIKYAFEELNIDLLSVYHYPHNERSKRVIENAVSIMKGLSGGQVQSIMEEFLMMYAIRLQKKSITVKSDNRDGFIILHLAACLFE